MPNQAAATSIYVVTILLSAFLLFQVQLVMGKFILPRFGGGSSVWSTSLLVFQLLLLCGYAYAAFVSARLQTRTQGKVHLALLVISGLLICATAGLWHAPIFPATKISETAGWHPVREIALLLLAGVGLYCVLLSATSPLLQKWFSNHNPGTSPYRLYAVSNLGSMLGLLTYPFLVERVLNLSVQGWVWAAGYILFVATAGRCAFVQLRVRDEPRLLPSRVHRSTAPIKQPRLLWMALAACASTMLLATTNLLSQEVAAIPLLWVLPLSLYLLSFIICFDHARWYRREVFQPLFVALGLLALYTMPNYSEIGVARLLMIFCAALMAACMVCHGELARMKPQAQHLTSFYLMVSLGGALGSAFVVLLAPQLFSRFWEFQIALFGSAILLVVALVSDKASWLHSGHLAWIGLAAAAIVAMAAAVHFTNQLLEFEGKGKLVASRTRNFFGVKTVLNMPEGMVLVHAHTLHGLQNRDPQIKFEPTAYYSRNSGIGLLLDHFPRAMGQAGLRVGVVGMGAGTLAAYARPGDYFRFYELDPAVPGLSEGLNPIFSFVQASRAESDVVLGDARLSLQNEATRGDLQKFDVLVVDAFSGDAVPVHLLTREAMGLYLRHLRGPQSVIAFHLSNSSLDLRPAASSLIDAYHLSSIELDSPPDYKPRWVLVSQEAGALQIPELVKAGGPLEVQRRVRTWTDDYSNLAELMTGW